MNQTARVIFSIFLFFAALLFGSMLSQFLFFYTATQKFRMPEVFDLFTTFQSVGFSGRLGEKLKISLLLGFGASLALISVVIYKVLNQEASVYGEAKFTTPAELQKKGYFEVKDHSIVVGHVNGKYLYFSGQQFALLAAPTRSGKGVGIVIPNLLTYNGSMVVLDIKQENFDLTSGFRQKHGQEVFLFNPFAEDGRSHRWNPLSYISKNVKFRVSDLSSLAVMLYPPSANPQGNDQFWKSQAQNIFIAFGLYLFSGRVRMSSRFSPCCEYWCNVSVVYF
jgi:type IV secretion system protein VirD4